LAECPQQNSHRSQSTLQRGAVMPVHRLQTHSIDAHDPIAAIEGRIPAAQSQRGYFSGPGWAPTWHGDDEGNVQTHAY
jgi:hypothetical protein